MGTLDGSSVTGGCVTLVVFAVVGGRRMAGSRAMCWPVLKPLLSPHYNTIVKICSAVGAFFLCIQAPRPTSTKSLYDGQTSTSVQRFSGCKALRQRLRSGQKR